MTEQTTTQRSLFSLWVQAIRPFSITATLIPVIFGALFTLAFYEGKVNWYLMILITLGAPFFQLAGNLLSEYYDFKNKVDTKETLGSSRVIIDGLMKPKTVLIGGWVLLGVLFLIGMVLTYYRGLDMLIIGIAGMIGSYIYTILKYRALGDLHIFIFFGPLMIFGTFYALTGSYEMIRQIAIVSIPIGFLVVAILHANNTRDIKHDGEAHIRTFAGVLGLRFSKIYYAFLLIGAYAAVGILVIFDMLPLWSLIVLITLPMAINNIKNIKKANFNEPKVIARLDEKTAKLHLLFGIFLSLSVLLDFLMP